MSVLQPKANHTSEIAYIIEQSKKNSNVQQLEDQTNAIFKTGRLAPTKDRMNTLSPLKTAKNVGIKRNLIGDDSVSDDKKVLSKDERDTALKIEKMAIGEAEV